MRFLKIVFQNIVLKRINNNSSGAFIIMAALIIAVVSVLCASYWLLFRANFQLISLKTKQIQIMYAAKGGMEKAVWRFLVKEGRLFKKKDSYYEEIDIFDPILVDIYIDKRQGVQESVILSQAKAKFKFKTIKYSIKSTIKKALSINIYSKD